MDRSPTWPHQQEASRLTQEFDTGIGGHAEGAHPIGCSTAIARCHEQPLLELRSGYYVHGEARCLLSGKAGVSERSFPQRRECADRIRMQTHSKRVAEQSIGRLLLPGASCERWEAPLRVLTEGSGEGKGMTSEGQTRNAWNTSNDFAD